MHRAPTAMCWHKLFSLQLADQRINTKLSFQITVHDKYRDFDFVDSLLVILAITAKWALYFQGPSGI